MKDNCTNCKSIAYCYDPAVAGRWEDKVCDNWKPSTKGEGKLPKFFKDDLTRELDEHAADQRQYRADIGTGMDDVDVPFRKGGDVL